MSYEPQAGVAYELELARKRIAELEGAREKDGIESSYDKAMIQQSVEKILACEHEAAESWALTVVLSALQSRGVVAEKQAAELERLRAEHRELSDQFIVNAQRLSSVCDNWHSWAVEIVGKESARKMSGQDMRDEILRRLAELARLRDFVDLVRSANEEPYMAETGYKLRRAFEFLDRAPAAQAEQQTSGEEPKGNDR